MNRFDLRQRRDELWESLEASANASAFDLEDFSRSLKELYAVDRFWTFPGRGVLWRLTHYLDEMQYTLIAQLVNNCRHYMMQDRYRFQAFSPFMTNLEWLDRPMLHESGNMEALSIHKPRPYFEVLIVHPCPDEYELLYRQHLATFKSPHDEFIYDIVLVDSAEDALTAVLANTDIQACIHLHHVPPGTETSAPLFERFTRPQLLHTLPVNYSESVEVNLCRTMRAIRPEIDHYLISELPASELPFSVRNHFDRVLFHVNPFRDLHEAIMNGVRNRFSTPFFAALQAYGRQPKGVFHALPLSRGASVRNSPWIRDMYDYYGESVFRVETSSTQGGLDSLLDPTGAILQAHMKAAEAFGADSTFFVTNGTSTSNKIVNQANLRPGDIVLISADCHKSIPYSVMLAGAFPVFLETWPIPSRDLYGGVELARIKEVMLDLKKCGRLEKLRQISLTSSTFDGLIYHCEKFMMEILAIKPDVIFHWDEAWSAFCGFHPLYYGRTAMSASKKIRQRMQDPAYREFHSQWRKEFDANPEEEKWDGPLYPHPDLVKLRVYSTQSTHKTLSAFRQASMIHVSDDLFDRASFVEAYRIYTSTSPNYQIVSSMDIARRQASLEGFYRVREAILLSLQLRRRIREEESLKPCFELLTDLEMVPERFRTPVGEGEGLAGLCSEWGYSDFVVDPTRITLDVSGCGIDGNNFRQLLMSRYDIQVNKTSRNTVLFLVNIGATRATVDYLFQVLMELAARFRMERRHHELPIFRESLPPLPRKRIFHPAFLPFEGGEDPPCDIRSAHYLGAEEYTTEYLPPPEALEAGRAGELQVSASFVTPYPPGFPVLVPGQFITPEILEYFHHARIPEIHGFSFEKGFRVFRKDYLEQGNRK
ncbi:MAG: ornithine decarboxylase [Burkholderiales bacterium]|nr:ornithine decarboxylase [Burkholderiales bacterium]